MKVCNVVMSDFAIRKTDEGLDELSLVNGNAISVVFISDAAKYEEHISKIITTLIPFKNINILYLDYTINKRKINKNRRAFLGDSDDIPVIHVYINEVLYHLVKKENINHEYISTLLKNLHKTFVFTKDFANDNTCNMQYVFHAGGGSAAARGLRHPPATP